MLIPECETLRITPKLKICELKVTQTFPNLQFFWPSIVICSSFVGIIYTVHRHNNLALHCTWEK